VEDGSRRRSTVTAFAHNRPKLRTVLLLVAGVVFVAVTFFRVPLATVFTLGVLLICPLLMVGMHGGGHDADHARGDVHGARVDGHGDATQIRHESPASEQGFDPHPDADDRRGVQP
jgi:hypothetical protein